jgi:hypothetical protein
MGQDSHPEPGVSYAAYPTAEYRAQSRLEAVQSPARFLGVEVRAAAALLDDKTAYAAEIRSRQAATAAASNRLLVAMTGDVAAAERALRRAWRP